MTSLNSSSVEDRKFIYVIYEKGHKDYDETISFVKIHLFGGRWGGGGREGTFMEFCLMSKTKKRIFKRNLSKGKGNPGCYCTVDCNQDYNVAAHPMKQLFKKWLVLLWAEENRIPAADMWETHFLYELRLMLDAQSSSSLYWGHGARVQIAKRAVHSTLILSVFLFSFWSIFTWPRFLYDEITGMSLYRFSVQTGLMFCCLKVFKHEVWVPGFRNEAFSCIHICIMWNEHFMEF